MKKTKRYCISMDENLHKLIVKTAGFMRMDFSSFIDFIARDKVAYFLRNRDKFFVGKDWDPFDEEYQKWDSDIEQTIKIARMLWFK